MISQPLLQRLLAAPSRADLWVAFLTCVRATAVAELGVHRGNFAQVLLSRCATIDTYYMIDPWRSLPNWNKPGNVPDEAQQQHYMRTINRTSEFDHRLRILRGTTLEVIDQIPDASLDFCYIDGDHTLRGITIDLLNVTRKVRFGGWIGGDDFTPSIWQHGPAYEPTLVFPFVVHFAEAMRLPLHSLPHCQFLLHNQPCHSGAFVDAIGSYSDHSLLSQCERRAALQQRIAP